MAKPKRHLSLLAVGLFLGCTLLLELPVEVRSKGEDQLLGNPLKGRNIFVNKSCVKCHSVWGQGGKLGPDLTRVGLGRNYLQVIGLLWGHSPQMTERMQQHGVPRPTFTPEEMSDLVAYLYYLNYLNEPGDAATGRVVYFEKGCSECHVLGNVGGRAGPSLNKYRGYDSALLIAQAMWNHSPGMSVRMQELKVKQASFQGHELADLLAYIRGLVASGLLNEKFMLPGSPLSGRRLFAEKNCVSCHAIHSQGGKIGPDLAQKRAYHSVTEIAGVMWNHGLQMGLKMKQTGKARPTFNKNEMADIIAYLYFIRYNDQPGDALSGKQLFAQKGCAECHALGHGWKLGPDFRTSVAPTSSLNLLTAMWNHAPGMEKLLREKKLPWIKFEGNQLRDLVEYLKTTAATRQAK
jgi:mono/diheme cytochrome c family protein